MSTFKNIRGGNGIIVPCTEERRADISRSERELAKVLRMFYIFILVVVTLV